jgi:intein-encoded DNA endonuclease-like protein
MNGKISIPYVRGFFDGEGSLTVIKYGGRISLAVDIAQNDKELLSLISDFLSTKGIKNNIKMGHNGKCSHLKIYSFPLVYKFIKLIKPQHPKFRVRIKRFMEHFIEYRKQTTSKAKKIRTITKLCLKGIKHTEIGKIVGMDKGHTYRYCKNPKHSHRFPKIHLNLNRY